MPKICFVQKKFRQEASLIIEASNFIIQEYQAKGMSITLRQLYYQFVSRGMIANSQKEYNKLKNIINDARLAGLVDWTAIEDRTRNLQSTPTWASPEDIIKASHVQYREDKWAKQPYRAEVWIEKDALLGVIENVCNEYEVPFISCRGYMSQSEMYSAVVRFVGYYEKNQRVLIIQMSDHDPSGVDMSDDIDNRINKVFGLRGWVEVRRVALTMDQVTQFNPPPNPTKQTDTRKDNYIDKCGDESWELDALDPTYIADLIENEILSIRDQKLWESAVRKQDKNRKRIKIQ
jgi:hypothetical protein